MASGRENVGAATIAPVSSNTSIFLHHLSYDLQRNSQDQRGTVHRLSPLALIFAPSDPARPIQLCITHESFQQSLLDSATATR